MTLAELQSTVTHAMQKAEEAKVPLHKVEVRVAADVSQCSASHVILDLYPGPIKFGEQNVLLLEAE